VLLDKIADLDVQVSPQQSPILCVCISVCIICVYVCVCLCMSVCRRLSLLHMATGHCWPTIRVLCVCETERERECVCAYVWVGGWVCMYVCLCVGMCVSVCGCGCVCVWMCDSPTTPHGHESLPPLLHHTNFPSYVYSIIFVYFIIVSITHLLSLHPKQKTCECEQYTWPPAPAAPPPFNVCCDAPTCDVTDSCVT